MTTLAQRLDRALTDKLDVTFAHHEPPDSADDAVLDATENALAGVLSVLAAGQPDVAASARHLAPPPEPDPELDRRVRTLLDASWAPETRRAYTSDLDAFAAWCRGPAVRAQALPAHPRTVARYLAVLYIDNELAVPTVQRAASAIAFAHRALNLPTPTLDAEVRHTLKGIRRDALHRPAKKHAITLDEIATMAALTDRTTLLGLRDRALLLTGWWASTRRTELVALNVDHLTHLDDGWVLDITRSKSDQEGEGRLVGVPYLDDPAACGARALADWLTTAEITDGPVFRPTTPRGQVSDSRLTSGSVARRVKRYARLAGIDPQRVSGHSLRSGSATEMLRRGAPLDLVRNHLRHAKVETTLEYRHITDVLDENPAHWVASTGRRPPRPGPTPQPARTDPTEPPQPYSAQLAATLRHARHLARLSQTDLAHITGIPQPTISTYENAKRTPPGDHVDQLLAACGHHAHITLTTAEKTPERSSRR